MFYNPQFLTRRGVFTLAWYVFDQKVCGNLSHSYSSHADLLFGPASLPMVSNRLAGTISGISLLKANLDRMVRVHGRANILSIWYVLQRPYLGPFPVFVDNVRIISLPFLQFEATNIDSRAIPLANPSTVTFLLQCLQCVDTTTCGPPLPTSESYVSTRHCAIVQ